MNDKVDEWVCTCERDSDGALQKLAADCPLHTEESRSMFEPWDQE